MDDRARRIQALIQAKRACSVSRKASDIHPEGESDADLEQAIRIAGEQAREEEKRLKRQVWEAEQAVQRAKTERDLEEARLKEKEQDLRICELKIREVRRQ